MVSIPRAPQWPLFLKVNPSTQGLNSKQNKGHHLGSLYIYISYIYKYSYLPHQHGWNTLYMLHFPRFQHQLKLTSPYSLSNQLGVVSSKLQEFPFHFCRQNLRVAAQNPTTITGMSKRNTQFEHKQSDTVSCCFFLSVFCWWGAMI